VRKTSPSIFLFYHKWQGSPEYLRSLLLSEGSRRAGRNAARAGLRERQRKTDPKGRRRSQIMTAKDSITALMGKGAEFQGQLSFKGTVRIDGRFLGSITSEGKLVLGKDAHVEGTISVGELEMHGALQGDVCVARRTLLHESAKLTGSLHTALLAMEEGAMLQGDLRMSKDIEPSANTHPLAQSEHPVHFPDSSLKQ
jgi:cytoskeletal protein CcmA (bactofilin family)